MANIVAEEQGQNIGEMMSSPFGSVLELSSGLAAAVLARQATGLEE